MDLLKKVKNLIDSKCSQKAGPFFSPSIATFGSEQHFIIVIKQVWPLPQGFPKAAPFYLPIILLILAENLLLIISPFISCINRIKLRLLRTESSKCCSRHIKKQGSLVTQTSRTRFCISTKPLLKPNQTMRKALSNTF